MNPENKEILLKLVFWGEPYSGKTSLLTRACDNVFQQNYVATIGVDFKTKRIVQDGVAYKLQMWDSAGQERFRAISAVYIRGAKGLFLTYDITNEKSFYEIQRLHQEILLQCKEFVPSMLLVGCKSDLVDQRAIPYDIGQALAANLGMGFIETSAKENSNCLDAVNLLTSMVIRNLPPPDQQIENKLQEQKPIPQKSGCC